MDKVQVSALAYFGHALADVPNILRFIQQDIVNQAVFIKNIENALFVFFHSHLDTD
jgi:hypothetical protein